jgi:hypothetical protein
MCILRIENVVLCTLRVFFFVVLVVFIWFARTVKFPVCCSRF